MEPVIWPVQDAEYPGIAADNDDDRKEEDDSVEEGVVDVSQLERRETNEKVLGGIARDNWNGEVLKEVKCGTLVELLGRVFHHPEDDGLGAGEQKGQDPAQQDHQSKACTVRICRKTPLCLFFFMR